MKNHCIIRPVASADEKEKCARLMAGSEPWLTLKRGIVECRWLFNDASTEKYVVSVKGTFAGFLVIDMRGPFAGYVRALGIAPEFRGNGIGGAVVRFAEKRIFTESPNVFLCVSSFNKRAQYFYRKLGFAAVGELKEFAVRGHSEILMRKSIGPKYAFKPKMKPI